MVDKENTIDVPATKSFESTLDQIETLPKTALQALYHEITGKTEVLSKYFEKYYVITFDDFNQIKYKIDQQLEHYDVIGPTISIEIQHKNLERQRFSSWDKFNEYDVSRTEPVTEVTIKFEFLVSLPGIKKHHRYLIEINMRSPLSEDSSNIKKMLRYVSQPIPTMRCKIDYVDYLVARNFLNAIDSWVASLSEVKTNHHYPFLQKNAFHFRFYAIRLGHIATIAFAYLISSVFLISDQAVSFENTGYWMMLVAAVFIITTIIMYTVSEILESFVTETRSVSRIQLNRGDERKYEEQILKNKTLVNKSIAAIIGLCGAILANVIAGLLLRM